MIILIIYLLGVIAALYMEYRFLEKGESVTLGQCACGILIAIVGCWITFIVVFLDKYGGKIVFTKK